MSRIQTRPTSPVSKLLIGLARRSVRKLAGSAPPGGVGPLEAYGLVPRVLVTYGLYEQATAKLDRVPAPLKALAELKAATMSRCPYCIDIGSQIARRTGVADEKLLALGAYASSDLFDPLEKLVLDYAVAMSNTPVVVPDELFAELRRHLDDAQIVELTNVIALENMRGRFNHALGFGAAGFSEGMVCAVPERVETAGHETAVQTSAQAASRNGDAAATTTPA